MEGLIQELLQDGHVWLTALVSFGVLRVGNQIEETFFRAHDRLWVRRLAALYRRALPVLPESIATLAVMSGSVPTYAGASLWTQVAIGFFCGFLSQRVHKILGQTILGDDRGAHMPTKATREEADTEPVVLPPEEVTDDREG